MNLELLLLVPLLMIGYDLSIHIIYLLKKEKYFLKRNIHYWPEWNGYKYQVFWTSFWGVAFIFLLAYMLLT